MAKLRIIADARERASGIPEILRKLGILVECRVLKVGDYVVSSDCAVERKEVSDFLKSLYSGRLLDQINRLSKLYEHPILVVEEGFTEMLHNISRPRVFWGAILTVAFNFDSHIFFTGESKQTVDFLYTLAKKERSAMKRGPIIRRMSETSGHRDKQLLLISTLPNVRPKLADRLLRHFGTARTVFSASVTELAKVKGLGRAGSEKISSILDSSYTSPNNSFRQIHLVETDEDLS